MAKTASSLWAVIMAGGQGTRFWPVSRKSQPKQFLAPGGDPPARRGRRAPKERSGDSLLGLTAKRLGGLIPPERTLVIGSSAHKELIRASLPEIPRHNIVFEPEGRNTAPCLGLAAHLIERWEPGALMCSFPADQHIGRPARLRRLVRAGAKHAQERNAIVTLGIEPGWPETGYGYIQRGRQFQLSGKLSAYSAKRFTEKPSLSQAKRYLASGGYYWNSGIFIIRAARVIDELDRQLPKTGRLLHQAATALRQGQQKVFDRDFRRCEAISIDYAVMEHARGIVVIPADIGWDDLGSWTSLRNLLPLDKDENLWILPKGSVSETKDARGLIVRSDKALVAAIGVENLAVIETEDVLLICSADRAQQVGELVKRLDRANLGRFL